MMGVRGILRITGACDSIGTSTNPGWSAGAEANERWARCVGERGGSVAVGGRRPLPTRLLTRSSKPPPTDL